MVYLFMSSVVLMLVCSSFHYLYCHSGIQEAYLGLYKGVIEECVTVAEGNGDYQNAPTFFMELARLRLKEYFNENLSPYCRSYEYAVDSYLFGDFTFPMSLASRIRVWFKATIDDVHQVEKLANFSIWRTDNG